MAKYTIYINGRVAVCPKCSGMITPMTYTLGFRCMDCSASYRVISNDTISERELICEDITYKTERKG